MTVNRSTRRGFLKWTSSAAVTALGTSLLPAAEPSAAPRPNILFIMVDEMPTLMEMIGRPLSPGAGFQGRSLVKLAAGKETAWKTAIFAERGSMMIRTAQYKLIKNQERDTRRGAGEYELYDLVKDPGEDVNLIDDPACASVAAGLKARLEAWQKDCPSRPMIPGVWTTQAVAAPATKKGQAKARRRQPSLRPNKKE